MRRVSVLLLILTSILAGRTPEWERARELYQRTEYRQTLTILLQTPEKDAATLQLIGRSYFMLAEYKKATEALEAAIALDPNNADSLHWLGRAYGRRAEMANPFSAPGLATKARQMFERSVALNPSNKEAAGDLLDYYLDAPGFLGGGMQKAEALAKVIGATDPAEGQYAQALIEDKRQQYDQAEEHFRRAAQIAPRQVGRFVALAKYLAKRGQFKESEAMFDRAAHMAPDDPKILFERATTYIKGKRNIDQARELLEKYVHAPLTPDDPPREQALAMLKKIGD